MIHFDFLTEPLISVATRTATGITRVSLPELYAALMRDEVTEYAALRPHQRHVWHAFLVQVGAIALHRAGVDTVPESPDMWRDLLRALTPGENELGAWALVAPSDQPAILQAPLPGAEEKKAKQVATPGQLDMLVTSRNHEVKIGLMSTARPEHWLFALVSLQTQEGYLGASNYGISRMNGGFSNRSGFGVVPAGGPGRRVRRDIRRLLALRGELLARYPAYPSSGGYGLLWSLPWDGETSLDIDRLDPFYVEVCRRVRIVANTHGVLSAATWGSRGSRIAAEESRGATGDPWAVVVRDKEGSKAYTFDPQSVGYRRLTPLLFPRLADADAAQRAPLQRIAADDDPQGLSLIVTGLVRGQGKTEGLFSRTIPVSGTRRSFMAELATDPIADCAHDRTRAAGDFVHRVFFPAALSVFTAAPSKGERARDDETNKERARHWCGRLDQFIDRGFFVALELEVSTITPAAARAARGAWLHALYDEAAVVLRDLLLRAPDAAMRHYRIRVRATDALDRCFRSYLKKEGFEATTHVIHAPDLEPDHTGEGDD